MTFRFEPKPEPLERQIQQRQDLQIRRKLLARITAQQEKYERARRRFDRLPEELVRRK
ncbi:hypothetical protein [Nitrospina gracilis]|uniref:hypothetical protein n=1 Tax=Nitrospina gracilis TaxID=35801 RepID=UPI001F329441|nr:hypothetical protein [Nitrospina gracilis]MCF8721833.1 hypothetical protein [Nitrospina gracilis Nb-211]